MRESTVRGAAIDINDFERRLRGVEPPRKSSGDPLSELARLMHGEEQAQAARRYDQMFAAESAPSTEWEEAVSRKAPDEDDFAAELRGSVHEEVQRTRPDSGAARESGAYSGEHASQARGNDFAAADLAARHFAARPGPQTRSAASDAPDAWPQDLGAASGHHESEDDVGYDDMDDAPAQGGSFRLRPWHAVAVVALLASSLLAWGFAKRGGVIGGREIAVINAPDGPAKVLPDANADASVDKPEAAVLDRHENSPVKRVVSHQEQAVEPKVESRANYNGAGQTDADGGQASSAGPQPKKIKTVSVRPDGSLITNAEVPPAVEKAAGAGSHDAAAKHASTTPATPARPSATPRVDKTAKPKAPQKVAAVEPEAEEKAPASTQKIATGGFSVQFGAAATEAEAHALVTKVATKYGSQLAGHKPTFKVAKVGDKTVYRVRASGMSKESAANVCGNVKSSGGTCFVAGD
jgi:SPOR domain